MPTPLHHSPAPPSNPRRKATPGAIPRSRATHARSHPPTHAGATKSRLGATPADFAAPARHSAPRPRQYRDRQGAERCPPRNPQGTPPPAPNPPSSQNPKLPTQNSQKRAERAPCVSTALPNALGRVTTRYQRKNTLFRKRKEDPNALRRSAPHRPRPLKTQNPKPKTGPRPVAQDC